MPKKFKESLQLGKRSERIVKEIYESVGCVCSYNEERARFTHFDLTCDLDGLEWTTEVKDDDMAYDTGNLAIEVKNTELGKPSGLSATRADLWAHVIGGRVWIATVKDLKAYVAANKPVHVLKDAGDKNAMVFLYPQTILPEVFKLLSSLNKSQARRLLCNMLDSLSKSS